MNRSWIGLAVLAAVACSHAPPAESRPTPPVDDPAGPAARPLVIAHRGYSDRAPEHTLPAYTLAHQAGADYIEIDLQMTADGVLIALHDSTLDRTARGPDEACTGDVGGLLLAQLQLCDVGSWFNEAKPDAARSDYASARVPTLAQLFNRFGLDTRYYIETKNPEEAPGMEEALVRTLRDHALFGEVVEPPRVILQSFSPESLRKLRQIAPDIPRVQLFGRMNAATVSDSLDAVARYADGIGPHFSSVDAALVRAAHERGLVVHPYTVNDPAEMRRLLGLGIDGFFTDRTELGLAEVAARR